MKLTGEHTPSCESGRVHGENCVCNRNYKPSKVVSGFHNTCVKCKQFCNGGDEYTHCKNKKRKRLPYNFINSILFEAGWERTNRREKMLGIKRILRHLVRKAVMEALKDAGSTPGRRLGIAQNVADRLLPKEK